MKLFLTIQIFLFVEISCFCQKTDKKLNYVLSSGLNHNDIHLGAIYITDRVFSNAISKITGNFGALLNYKLEKILSIEGGLFFVSQKVGLNQFVYYKGSDVYVFESNAYNITANGTFTGEIKANSYIIPGRILLLLNPIGKFRTKLIGGLLKQLNYIYKESGDFNANLINVNGKEPIQDEKLNNYLKKRFVNENQGTYGKYTNIEKSNNLGFLIGVNIEILKKLDLELNKHFNEVRPQIRAVYSYNFSSLNLRYSF